MAQVNKRPRKGSGASGAKGSPGPKDAPASRNPAARQSVAAARASSGGSNRTQLIIGGIAIVVIVVIIVVGLVLNKRATAVQSEGYGASTQSVATASADGLVTVSKPGSTPKLTLDIYEDALCPICAEFERQYGQQVNKAVDEGSLAVNYHMLNFLNKSSFSGDYSTRAAAALLCVAQQDGSTPGAYLAFHSALFSPDNQPAESGSADLTNDQLAALATSSGAPAAAQCISSGQNAAAAAASATASSATLSKATGGTVATPTIVHNGVPVQLTVTWLGDLLGQS